MKATGLARLIGLEVEVTGQGSAEATVEVEPGKHHNPNGVVHGGVIFTIIDTAMGAATHSVLEPGESCASVEVHTRFIATSLGGLLRARAQIVHRGRRVVQLEARVSDADERLVATGTGSFAVTATN